MGVIETLHAIVDIGLIHVRPFANWDGVPIKDIVVTMRLLNSEELREVAIAANEFALGTIPHTHLLQIHTLAKIIHTWDGTLLTTQDDLDKYNEEHESALTMLDYKIKWLGTLEKPVHDVLDAMYNELRSKQERLMRGLVKCEISGDVMRREKAKSEDGTIWLDEYELCEIRSVVGQEAERIAAEVDTGAEPGDQTTA